MAMRNVDTKKREEEAMELLRNSYKLINDKNIHKIVITSNPSFSNCDVTTMCLEAIQDEVKELEGHVNAYEGPHFTRNYQVLQGEFSKLSADLDVLKAAGRDDIRRARKSLLIRIEKMGDDLAEKTHPSGQSCPLCEMKL